MNMDKEYRETKDSPKYKIKRCNYLYILARYTWHI